MIENDFKTALGIMELPLGSSVPSLTPPEGVIVPALEADGWTRKYLHRTSMGADGRVKSNRILMAEIPPAGGVPAPLQMLSGPAPAPNSGLQVPANGMVRPMSVRLAGPVQLGRTGLGQAFPIGGGSLPVAQPSFPGDYPAQAQGSPAGSPPAALEPVCPEAPIQMKDGSFLGPDDPVTFAALCELMPIVAEALEILKRNNSNGKGAPGGNRLGPVTVVGGRPGGPAGVPSSMSPFGGMQQSSGAGGGGGGWGGGGTGARGAQGIQGPVGAGGLTDFIVKTDGDFIAGPGPFIVVPGTTINFTVTNAGVGHFFLDATLGATSGASSLSQNGQIGLRIDGVDYPLATHLLHTFGGGIGEFMLGQAGVLPLQLSAGAHQVDVILRGIAIGEFGGTGLGLSAGVCAVPAVPLYLSVIHS